MIKYTPIFSSFANSIVFAGPKTMNAVARASAFIAVLSSTVTDANFTGSYWHQTTWTDGDRYDSDQS